MQQRQREGQWPVWNEDGGMGYESFRTAMISFLAGYCPELAATV